MPRITGPNAVVDTVKVVYDTEKVSLGFLLSLYFQTIDPTSVNRQGGDHGTQYRTGIYYVDAADKPVIEQAISQLQQHYSAPIVIEVMPLHNFYPAEDYHQDYLDKNPGGYCHVSPALFRLAREAKDPSINHAQD